MTHYSWQTVFSIFQNVWYTFGNRMDPLRDDDAELREQTTYLVALRGSSPHFSHPDCSGFSME